MRVALVFNPFKYKLHEENLRIVQRYFGLFPPLSLAWVAAIAEKAGHEVILVDARTLRLTKQEVLHRLRAFRPDIKYQYTVKDETLEGTSFLRVPGFGGRMNRLDAADKLVHLYPAGKSITVYYNPENRKESTLQPTPAYSIFLKLGTSILLSVIGMTVIFMAGYQKKEPHPLYKERT